MAFTVNHVDEADYDLHDYDIYGKTPPRTKILRKNRERRQRSTTDMSVASPKIIKPKQLVRRKTVSNTFDELVAKADTDSDGSNSKRTSKRQMKLLRGSERDLKLDIGIASGQAAASDSKNVPKTPQPSYPVQCRNPFKSLLCRTKPCKLSMLVSPKTVQNEGYSRNLAVDVLDDCPNSRTEFYNTFSMLIRMGRGERTNDCPYPKRMISREEQLYNNELKDLIWLELQAHHADRTPSEEDIYLCNEREKVEPLLRDIMSYRFLRHAKPYSTQNSDSGVEDDCDGCFSIYCMSCLEAQNEALKDIDELMRRLAAAEALFPSGHSFAENFPTYNSPEFVGRVKAISLWYNMVKHHRLKLVILSKLFENKGFHSAPRDENYQESSPSDSNNSSSSNSTVEVTDIKTCLDPATFCCSVFPMLTGKTGASPYRKYIENILKTRTLHKSLSFLDKLKVYLLRKTQWSLTKPENADLFKVVECASEEEELQRFGAWSPEAQAINLPSYRANFLFIAIIPLQMIHEFLKMRIEEKPANPSPLSIRQLMRELKQGLTIANSQKKNTVSYIETAIAGTCKEGEDFYRDRFSDYNKCLARVFTDYLDYVEMWALLNHDTFQKNLLEEEWQFSLDIIDDIPNGSIILANKFCNILCTIIQHLANRLHERLAERFSTCKCDGKNFKHNLFSICRDIQVIINEEREMSIKTIAFCKTIFKQDDLPDELRIKLSKAIISLKCSIPHAIECIQSEFDQCHLYGLDEVDKASIITRSREILMQGYRFGFEFYKEMSESVPTEFREKLARSMIQFAKLWMKFVTECCDRGRGKRPRWAYQGLEFLLTVSDPHNTRHLSNDEFELLKQDMDVCISHVIGTTAPSTPESGFHSASPRPSIDLRTRSRGSSPSPRPSYKSQRSNPRKTSMERVSPADSMDSSCYRREEKRNLRAEAIENLESTLDDKLRQQQLIGKVITSNGIGKPHIRRRIVTFTWQRGIKIGQGRFGKVYTAVNNKTGEMMAVKEIALQHNDVHTITRAATEIKILEGIHHEHLVRHYGMEVHKDEMLIFMEFCAEGTLDALVVASEGGLPELLVRKYTNQLASGVGSLHEHGIVHRDIKTANIFLTDNGNCLKIGDFGCAAKIKSNTTMPGELQGFVGTQAYMAPEVFMKNMNEGHGRAADVWSIGCVVVEMASGKRPWAQFDSNYQIMFKVGMGESPDPPDDMSAEGLDFLKKCFQHNPTKRASALQLLDHSFVQGSDDY